MAGPDSSGGLHPTGSPKVGEQFTGSRAEPAWRAVGGSLRLGWGGGVGGVLGGRAGGGAATAGRAFGEIAEKRGCTAFIVPDARFSAVQVFSPLILPRA